ncbi:MAG: PBP1A family penicillin-binding protein [Pseudomonadota bacterium]
MKLGPILINSRTFKFAAYGFAGLAFTGVIGAFFLFQAIYGDMPDLPDNDDLWAVKRDQAYEFRDSDGDLITVRGPHYGQVIKSSELAPHVVQAFIAAEDKRFYDHDGADTTAIARAAWSNWRSGRTVSGASTITQQTVKFLLLDFGQTIKRKLQEVRLARQLEKQMSKEEILTLYLNRIYFGSGAYGIDAAAEEYFGKEATELSLAEAALLATLPKAPSRLALDSNLEGARERQLYVLNEMVNAGYIREAQKDAAYEQEISLSQASESGGDFGHILDAVTERIAQILPDAPGDLVITLSIDADVQRAVQTKIADAIETNSEDMKVSEAAAVMIRPNGAVLALVGGVDYETSKFNRALQAKRQPGSAFKPFVFAAALQTGIDPFSVYNDELVRFDDWEPKNYVDGYVGPVTIAEAFSKSLNTVAAQLGQDVGEERIISLARSFGITSDLRPLPSIALGSQEVSLYELTRAYGVFAKSGNRLDPYMILKVEDSRGQLIYERPEYEPVEIFPANLTKDMNAMLARVIQGGTGARAAIPGWTAAGKTGTSQDWRDAWFVGFTSQLIGGVWVGNDDDSPMNRVSGGGLPADIWSDIMAIGLEGQSPRALAGAEGIVKLSPAAEERIAFYRGLSQAFDAIEAGTLAASAKDASFRR